MKKRMKKRSNCSVEGCDWTEDPKRRGVYVKGGYVCPLHSRLYDAKGVRILDLLASNSIQYVHSKDEEKVLIPNTPIQTSEQLHTGALQTERPGNYPEELPDTHQVSEICE